MEQYEPEAYVLGVEQVIERRTPDRYAAYVPHLGVVGYGETPAAAATEADAVTLALLGDISERDGVDAALARLSRAGVPWTELGAGHHRRSLTVRLHDGRFRSFERTEEEPHG